MNTIESVFSELKQDWSSPKSAIHKGVKSPFMHVCEFGSEQDSEANLESDSRKVPTEIAEFFRKIGSATLFKDIEHGQWGLELLSVNDVERDTALYREDYNANAFATDLVIGRFLGDTELLVADCDPTSSEYGSVLVALPLDDRSDWPTVGDSLLRFLGKYCSEQGAKFWD